MKDITVKLIDENGKICESRKFTQTSFITRPVSFYLDELSDRVKETYNISGNYQINIEFENN